MCVALPLWCFIKRLSVSQSFGVRYLCMDYTVAGVEKKDIDLKLLHNIKKYT